MRFFTGASLKAAVAVAVVLMATSAHATNYWATAELCSVFTDKCFPVTFWNMDAPASGTQEMWRLEIEINPLDPSEREVIIRRLDRPDLGPDSLMQFQLPFDARFGSPFDCCIHESIGTSSKAKVPGVVNGTFDLPRKDGFRTVRLLDVFTNETEANLIEFILRDSNPTESWDDVNTVCPVSCGVQSNFVFVVDGSGSISTTEFNALTSFMVRFLERTEISESASNVGYVYYGAPGSASVPGMRYCVFGTAGVLGTGSFCDSGTSSGCGGTYKQDNTNALNLWYQALGDPDWFELIPWPEASSGLTQDDLFCFPLPGIVTTCDGGSSPDCSPGVIAAPLYITPDRERALDVFQNMATIRSAGDIYRGGTPTGAGIQMGIDLFERTAIYRPTVPEIMIVLSDGQSNVGINAVDASAVARSLGIVTFAINLVNGNQAQLELVAGDVSRYFEVTAFTDAAFDAVLDPLLEATCLGESGTGASCAFCPLESFCSSCSSCVVCLDDTDCEQCETCNINTRRCTTLPDEVACPFDSPSDCEKWTCSNTDGCSVVTNPAAIASFEAECKDQDGTWNTTACFCDIEFDEDDGDGSNENEIIVGTTVGAAGAAGAAGLATALGALALCCLAAFALLALLAAALVIIAVLLIGLLVLAVVGGLGIAGLVMGIQLAIPPSIAGIEIASKADVTSMESPLAKESAWQSNAVTED